MSDPFKFTLNYKGYNIEMVAPLDEVSNAEEAELSLRDSLEKQPEMTFVSKNWITPKSMLE